MSRDEKLQIVSNVLNNTKVFNTIADALGELWINPNDDFFHDVEEFILDNIERMDEELVRDSMFKELRDSSEIDTSESMQSHHERFSDYGEDR